MKDHEVLVDRSTTPPAITFAETFNVTVPFLDRHIEAGRGSKIAVRWKNRELTFGEMAANVSRAANAFRALGVRPGERVIMLVSDIPDFYSVFLGAIRMGAIPIPVNYFLRHHDYAYMLGDAKPAVFVACPDALPEAIKALESYRDTPVHCFVTGDARDGWQSFADLIRGQSERSDPMATTASTDCFWLYSSGSTGDPKASVHQHKDMIYTSEYYGIGIAGIDANSVILSPPKAFFAYGLGNSVSFPLWTGATVALIEERPTPDNTLDMINFAKPTHYFGIPTLYAAQLHVLEKGKKVDCSGIRFCASGGEPLPPAIFENWKRITGHEIMDSIGSSEVLHFYTSNRRGLLKVGSAGQIVPGYEGRVVDENGADVETGKIGQLLIKGESTAKYYWNKPDKTAALMRGDWFCTGDTCYRDEDGYYYFCGRNSDMLKVGGIWVSPFEIESALAAHSAVLEGAVVGWPDAEGLIKPRAFVVLRDPALAGPALEEELKQFVRTRLAPFKYPRWIEFIPELPKTSSGKIQRFMLRSKS